MAWSLSWLLNNLPKQVRLNSLLVLLVIGCLALPQILSGYIVYFLSLTAIHVIVAVGLNLLVGYAGLISIGHAGFYAIGAYTSAILMTRLDLPFWIATPAAGLIAGLAGLILGLPALRLSGLYLATATLGFGVVVPQVILQWADLSGGHMGLRVPRPSLGAFAFDDDARFFYLVFAVMALMIGLAHGAVTTKAGRAWVALRDSETAAQAMGVHLASYKTLAFAVSAAYAGVAGSLLGQLITFIGPDAFTLGKSISFLTFIVIGGLASLPGSVLGPVLLSSLPQILSGLKPLPTIIQSGSLILVIWFLPGGLIRAGGALHALIVRTRRRRVKGDVC